MKKLFKDNYPELYAEVHPLKNMDIDFSEIYENSGLKIWWQCKKNPKHIWRQMITNRAKNKYGCPYCSGRKTLPEDSFAALFPELLLEVNTVKNPNFDPHKYRPGSNKVIWWKCKYGHEWKQRIGHRVYRNSKCKICEKIEKSLKNRYPEIAKEWHTHKNGELKPIDVSPSSKIKVWWKCSRVPMHEWEVSIKTRVHSKTGCPICAKLKNGNAKQYPSLDIYSPTLAKQWNINKNDGLNPKDFKPNSSKKVWWVCPANPEHEWESTIRNRAIQNKGCPFCSNTRVSPENSFVNRFPTMAKQWHPNKNGSLKASDFSFGSSKKIWWQCVKDKSHEWQSTIVARTQRNKNECPICVKSTYAASNSLQAVHPDIAAQWHPTKNGSLKPNDVTRASGKKVWWQCKENKDHVWETQIKNRTILGGGCSVCAKEKNIIRMSEHLYDLVHTDIDYYHVFLRNMKVLQKITDFEIHKNRATIQSFYRMIYTSVITTLEVFLSDAFYKKIINNENLIEKFITSNPEFNKKQYSLTEVIDWERNLNKKITEYLFNIIWHNLPKIQNMYLHILGVYFPNEIDTLHKAIAIRHDIVHRNGRTKKGTVIKLTKIQIHNLIEYVTEFVTSINEQLEKMNSEPQH